MPFKTSSRVKAMPMQSYSSDSPLTHKQRLAALARRFVCQKSLMYSIEKWIRTIVHDNLGLGTQIRFFTCIPAVAQRPPIVPVVRENTAQAIAPATAPSSHRLGNIDLTRK